MLMKSIGREVPVINLITPGLRERKLNPLKTGTVNNRRKTLLSLANTGSAAQEGPCKPSGLLLPITESRITASPKIAQKFEDRNFDLDPVIVGCKPTPMLYTGKRPISQYILPRRSITQSINSINEKEFNLGIINCSNPKEDINRGNYISKTSSIKENECNSSKRNETDRDLLQIMTTEVTEENLGNRTEGAMKNWKRLARALLRKRRKNSLNEADIKLFGRSNTGLEDLKVEERRNWVIHPDSKVKICWSAIMVIALIFTAIYIPIRIAFIEEISIEFMVIEYFIDALFFVDIFVNFVSAYYDENHNLITDNKEIAKKYLKGWFLIDLLACFPFQYFEQSDSKGVSYNKLLRLLRLGRLYRIIKILNFLRVLKVVKNSKTYEKLLIAMKMNAGIKRLIKTVLTFILVLHFFSCIWFYTARFNDFSPETWAMTLTTIGYGDIIPYTRTERVLSLIYIFVGVGFVSYCIGSLSSIMMSSDTNRQKFKEKIMVLDELALSMKMDSDLYYKIKKIIRKNHETNFYSDLSHETLLDELPATLRSQLVTLLYQQNNLGVVAFFQGKSPDFLNDILPLLKRITLEQDEIIYRNGDWADERSIKLVSSDNFEYRSYIEGSYFGETEILTETKFRVESTVAEEACELLTLKKSDLIALLMQYQDVKDQMFHILKKRIENNEKSLTIARDTGLLANQILQEKIEVGKQQSLYNIEYLSNDITPRKKPIRRRNTIISTSLLIEENHNLSPLHRKRNSGILHLRQVSEESSFDDSSYEVGSCSISSAPALSPLSPNEEYKMPNISDMDIQKVDFKKTGVVIPRRKISGRSLNKIKGFTAVCERTLNKSNNTTSQVRKRFKPRASLRTKEEAERRLPHLISPLLNDGRDRKRSVNKREIMNKQTAILTELKEEVHFLKQERIGQNYYTPQLKSRPFLFNNKGNVKNSITWKNELIKIQNPFI